MCRSLPLTRQSHMKFSLLDAVSCIFLKGHCNCIGYGCIALHIENYRNQLDFIRCSKPRALRVLRSHQLDSPERAVCFMKACCTDKKVSLEKIVYC